MSEKKGSKIKKNIKQREPENRDVKHVCGKEDPRRCLCWACIRDVCKTCNQIF